jgi:riboflavin synthase alpha subunit
MTVQAVAGRRFKVAVIPHTLRATNLGRRRKGEWLNLEVDLVARYLARLSKALKTGRAGGLKMGALRRHGF